MAAPISTPPPPAPATPAAPATAAWSAPPGWVSAWRPGFRFLFCYLLIYGLQPALTSTPGTAWLAAKYLEMWQVVVPWVGSHVLHLERDIASAPTGSGDRTFDYVQVLCMLALAAAAALVWSVADRRRPPPRWLAAGLRIYLRYVLAAILLAQGMSLLLKVQFPFPSLERLQQRIGDSSPMGLLWTFMGYSTPYDVFAGALEACGGFLLFFRRTTTLGALLSLGALGNVAMLNLSYDVPQKLFSLHLLLMAAYLLAPDARRLADGLLLERPTRPASVAASPSGRRARIARLALKAVVVCGVLLAATQPSLDRLQARRQAPQPPLYGVYDVEGFVRNGRPVPLWSFDAARWRQLIVARPEALVVNLMDDSRRTFSTAYGAQGVALQCDGKAGGKVPCGALAWSRPDADHLLLRGALEGEALTIKLHRIDRSYLLVSRGFRLIIDDPINR